MGFLSCKRDFFILTKEGGKKKERKDIKEKRGYFNFHLRVGGGSHWLRLGHEGLPFF
jgi:hypothetical protein